MNYLNELEKQHKNLVKYLETCPDDETQFVKGQLLAFETAIAFFEYCRNLSLHPQQTDESKEQS